MGNGIDMDPVAAIKAFFAEQSWKYETTEDDPPTFRAGFEGDSGRWRCYARFYPDSHEFMFYSVFPIDTPPDQRQAMMECITRANSGMTVGNFEIDLDDGEVLCKTSIDIEGERLTPGLVRNAAFANILAMDTYYPALHDVVYAHANAADAIARIE